MLCVAQSRCSVGYDEDWEQGLEGGECTSFALGSWGVGSLHRMNKRKLGGCRERHPVWAWLRGDAGWQTQEWKLSQETGVGEPIPGEGRGVRACRTELKRGSENTLTVMGVPMKPLL